MNVLRILCLLSCVLANAATYYVRTDGNDTNDGTANDAAHAWLTVQKAANTVVAGDTVRVQAGTYAEKITESTSGSGASRITYMADGAVTVGGWILSGAYITLNGFNQSGSGVTDYDGAVDVRNSNVTVTGCTFTNLQDNVNAIRQDSRSYTNCYIDACVFDSQNYINIMLDGKYHTVTNCYFTGSTGWDGIWFLCTDSVATHNRFINFYGSPETYLENHGDLIQGFSEVAGYWSTNNTFCYNYASNIYYMQIVMLEDQQQDGHCADWTFYNNVFIGPSMQANIYVDSVEWYNNTFVGCSTLNYGHVLRFAQSDTKGDGTNGRVYNNIFFECGDDAASATKGWYAFDAQATGGVTDYNLVIGTGAGTTKTGFSETHGINGSDPLFIAEYSNLRLQSGSPCISAATNLSAYFTDDYSGAVRGAPWDIGAYEFQATVKASLRGGKIGKGKL